MEFIKAMEILKRMCDKQENCFSCPFNGMKNCYGDTNEQLIKSEQILTDWDKANPVKTFMQDFFEKFPNAPKMKSTAPYACPHYFGYVPILDSNCQYAHGDCLKCWNRPLESEDK